MLTKPSAPDALDFEITNVRMNAARPPPPRGRRIASIADIRVILPLEGIKEEIFGDTQDIQHWRMQRGDALVLRPNTWLCPLFHTRHRHVGLIVRPDSLRVCWNRCPGSNDATSPLLIDYETLIPLPQGSALRHVLDALVAMDDVGMITGEGPSLVGTVTHLVRDALAKPASVGKRGDRTWAALVSYVYDHYHLTIGRDVVAAALGLSPSYLSRLCRQRTGTSFIEYLNGVRLQNAARMLHHIEIPILEIAHSCGFSEAGYFIRRFRRSYGTTPAAWRRDQLT